MTSPANLNLRQLLTLTAMFAVTMFLSVPAGIAYGQVEAPKTGGDENSNPLLQPLPAAGSDRLPLSTAEQSVKTRDIYNATRTAKTLTDYQGIVAKCDNALRFQLTDQNEEYVRSLKGWALNRSAEKRIDLARELKSIGSVKQFQLNYEKALAEFEQAVILAPRRQRTWNSWGIALVLDRQWSESVKKFTRAIELKTDYTAAWFNRAEALFQAGLYKQAVENYSFVIRMNSNDLEALNGRGLAHLANSSFESAQADFEAVLKMSPDRPEALINRGDLKCALGQWQEALDDYEAASRSPHLVAQQRTAWLLATCPEQELRDGAKAVKLIESCIASGNQTAEALETLAAAKARVGEFEAAQASQAKAIQLVAGQTELSESSGAKLRLTLYEDQKPFAQDAQPPADR